MKKMESITAVSIWVIVVIEMVEQYERCYYLGAYTGQECELCPHRDECKEEKENDMPQLRKSDAIQ